jgi:hypothetical protein
MFAKYITAGVVGSALLASVAFAETPATGQSFEGNWRASKVVGLNVYNEKNEKIGSINDLLMEKSGKVNAAVIGVGGFLGMGEHLVAVSFDKLKFSDTPVTYTGASNTNGKPASTTTTGAASTNTSTKSKWYPDHALFNATKDELKSMPEFKYSE